MTSKFEALVGVPAEVDIAGATIAVRGLSLREIAALGKKFTALKSAFASADPDTADGTKPDDHTEMLEHIPDALEALCCAGTDTPAESPDAKLLAQVPLERQAKLAGAILNATWAGADKTVGEFLKEMGSDMGELILNSIKDDDQERPVVRPMPSLVPTEPATSSVPSTA